MLKRMSFVDEEHALSGEQGCYKELKKLEYAVRFYQEELSYTHKQLIELRILYQEMIDINKNLRNHLEKEWKKENK